MTRPFLAKMACRAAAAAAVLMLAPTIAAAAQIVIRPAQLRPISNRQQSFQDFISVSGTPATAAQFWVPVRLPAGTRIRGLRYQHGSSDGSGTMVMLAGFHPSTDPASLTMIGGSSTLNTLANLEFTTVAGDFLPGVTHRIRPGWRYEIIVISENYNAHVGKIHVLY